MPDQLGCVLDLNTLFALRRWDAERIGLVTANSIDTAAIEENTRWGTRILHRIMKQIPWDIVDAVQQHELPRSDTAPTGEQYGDLT